MLVCYTNMPHAQLIGHELVNGLHDSMDPDAKSGAVFSMFTGVITLLQGLVL